MSGWRGRRVLGLLVLVLFGTAAAVAVAWGGGAEGTAATSDVPEGPEVNFCPTPQQTEEHLKAYGFDYKPTVSCTADGQVDSAPAQDPAEPADPDSGLSQPERDQQEKQALLNARAVPSDGDTCTIDGEYRDGEKVGILLMGPCPTEEVTPQEFADGVFGR